MTPGPLALIWRAAVSRSFQLLGCQSAGRPALAKIFLLYQRPRVSVPIGMPYVWPSPALPAFLAAPTNWLQSGHELSLESSGRRNLASASELTKNVSS